MKHRNFYIFSYGSNLLLQRIKERVASVAVVGKHELQGYKLAFNKQSIDGSTKANLVATGNSSDSTWGVIHRISQADKPILDQYEALGYGYLHMTFPLNIEDQEQLIHAYVATEPQYLAIGDPYEWYLNFVIEGAIENGFPEDYINQLKLRPFKTDTDLSRIEDNRAILTRS